jgi:hypothetical protein
MARPKQRFRLLAIRDNLKARIAEAQREGWLGEVEGLQVSLSAADEKLARIQRRCNTTSTKADLGVPAFQDET